jgi:hypothetical protein
VGRFADNPDFELRWPHEALTGELTRLIVRGRLEGVSHEWKAEVDLLLRQAFGAGVPTESFDRVASSRWGMGDDEEPF